MKLKEYVNAASLILTPHPPGALNVPAYYKDPDGHNKAVWDLEVDSSLAYARALAWKTYGDSLAHDLAKQYVMAWANTLTTLGNDEAKLVFAYKGQRFICAALWCSWTPEERLLLCSWIEAVVRPVALELTKRWNNWGAWGYALLALCDKVQCGRVDDATIQGALKHIRRATWNVPIFGAKRHLWMENMRTTYALKYGWFALEGYLLAAVVSSSLILTQEVVACLNAYWPYTINPSDYCWRKLRWLVPGFVFPSGTEFLQPSAASWPAQLYRIAGSMMGEPFWMMYGQTDVHDGFNAFRWPVETYAAMK